MFVLKDETYWWPITVHTPQDGGGWRESTFDARFKLVDLGQMLAAEAEAIAALEASGVPRAEIRERDAMMPVLREAWIGWRGIYHAGANGEPDEERPIEFSAGTRDVLLRDRVDVRRAVWEGFTRSIGPHQDPAGN